MSDERIILGGYLTLASLLAAASLLACFAPRLRRLRFPAGSVAAEGEAASGRATIGRDAARGPREVPRGAAVGTAPRVWHLMTVPPLAALGCWFLGPFDPARPMHHVVGLLLGCLAVAVSFWRPRS